MEKKLTKPFYLASEFWVVLVTAILAVVTAAGLLTPEESKEIEGAAAQLIIALTALVAVLAPVISAVAYIWSRTKIKDAIGKVLAGETAQS